MKSAITSSDATSHHAGSMGDALTGTGPEKNFIAWRSPFSHQLYRGDRLLNDKGLVLIVRGCTPGDGIIVMRCNDRLHMRLDWNNVQDLLNSGLLRLETD